MINNRVEKSLRYTNTDMYFLDNILHYWAAFSSTPLILLSTNNAHFTLYFFANACFLNFQFLYWDLQRCTNNIKKLYEKSWGTSRICNSQVILQHKLLETLQNLLWELRDLLDFLWNLLELLPIFIRTI